MVKGCDSDVIPERLFHLNSCSFRILDRKAHFTKFISQTVNELDQQLKKFVLTSLGSHSIRQPPLPRGLNDLDSNEVDIWLARSQTAELGDIMMVEFLRPSASALSETSPGRLVGQLLGADAAAALSSFTGLQICNRCCLPPSTTFL